MKADTSLHAIGRRKTSTARVFIKAGKGEILCNGRKFEEYFPRQVLQIIVRRPLIDVEGLEKYSVNLLLNGGGPAGQAQAARLAIARALLKVDSAMRPALKKQGHLSRDSREVERKKYGRHKARKRPQYSKR